MNRILLSSFLLITFCSCNAQQKKTTPDYSSKPKLVIGIVVDQMRYDYIERYWNNLGEGGFKRLVNEGTFFKNCHYNYVPTETAPGHSTIYTGTTPSVHGIVSNAWWSDIAKKSLSSVQDEDNPLSLSPKKLLVETLTDRYKSSFEGSRVYSISLKDRAAILPGGKTADAAFWYDDATGNFISSEYYNKENTTAKWVADFNAINYPKQFLKNGWNLNPSHKYEYPDSSSYEGTLGIDNKTYFPYRFDSSNYAALRSTSWGNKLIAQFASTAFKKLQLGQNKIPDFLCISFSSTDYVGHKFGINSVELEQTYMDLDVDIANLLSSFDKQLGKNNYLVFLTADHGAVSNPQYLIDHGQPGGFIIIDSLKQKIKTLSGDKPAQDSLILDFGGDQIKFNDALINKNNWNKDSIVFLFQEYLMKQPGVLLALSNVELKTHRYNDSVEHMIQNGFHPMRNADIMFVLKPNWLSWYSKKGTSHGSPYDYDTHVPLIFYGWHIKKSKPDTEVKVIDIAPTVSTLLGIPIPNGATGKPINEVLK